MKILILDNYDSFTYNLVLLVTQLTGTRPEVYRNDQLKIEAVAAFDKIILSPGPGVPEQAGVMQALIREYAPSKSILGVCLGHQGIAAAFGGHLINMGQVAHGIALPVQHYEDDYLFEDVPSLFDAGRYHSWAVCREQLPPCLQVTASGTEHGHIMALRHRSYDVRGIQFHPESVMTPQGRNMMTNWLKH